MHWPEANNARVKKWASRLAAQRRSSSQGPACNTTLRGISQAATCIIPPPVHDSISQSTGARSCQTFSGLKTASDVLLLNLAQAPDAIVIDSDFCRLEI